MALYVDYNKPIGYVKYHWFDKNNIGHLTNCVIYQCNGYFAIVYNKSQLIMFAVDNKHFRKCVEDNLYERFSNWNLSCDNNIARGMMIILTKHNVVVKYANQKTIENRIKEFC